MPAGTGTRRAPAGTRHSSAKPPEDPAPSTRSPGLTCVTPAPTSFTTPANSEPGVKGGVALTWYLFWITSTSGKLTLAALTATTTSPGPGRGEGRSSTTRVSGGPNCLQSTAFMILLRAALVLAARGAAVDREYAPRGVGRARRDEERRRPGDLLRSRGPAERHAGKELLVARCVAEQRLGALLVQARQAVGRYRPRIDAEHADAVRRRGAAERAREGHQASVRRAAGDVGRVHPLARRADDVEDHAAPAALHRRVHLT